MEVASTLQGKSIEGLTRAKENLKKLQSAVGRPDVDAVFELACRLIVTKSLPAWTEEACTEHTRRQRDLDSARS
jgi:hypothetical protein